KEAGLLLDKHGYIVPSSGYPGLICNSLVWLISKLVNFIAASKDVSLRTLLDC
ncbi:hypothetical protein BCR34DRAFT_495453, partial [Clohesyomyces aquaticus]